MHDSHRKQPARTTIVGGQPPGNARDLPPVPAGLEDLLSLAAASPDFTAALLRDRDRAAQAAQVSLSPAEAAILGAVPEASLQQMISRVGSNLPQPERRFFLERAAVAVAILLGGSALEACADKPPTARQSSPDPSKTIPQDGGTAVRPAPPVRPRKEELDVDGGARPDRAPGPIDRNPVPAGIRPDSPPSTTGIRPDRPRRPDEVHLIGGIQPARVKPPTDAPEDGESTTPIGGVRPTRPKPSSP